MATRKLKIRLQIAFSGEIHIIAPIILKCGRSVKNSIAGSRVSELSQKGSHVCLKANLQTVRDTIDACKKACGRQYDTVQLMVITKTIPAGTVAQLAALGVVDIGENRVQEAKAKKERVPYPFRWHLVGHLQTNKVSVAVDVFQSIHSVDSLRVATAIHRCSKKRSKIMDVFLEVNTSGEQSKYGFTPDALRQNMEGLRALAHIRIQGLMTMAPWTEDHRVIRKTFADLRRLREELCPGGRLSMGMSRDYPIAIEEGADIVRIGSAVFE